METIDDVVREIRGRCEDGTFLSGSEVERFVDRLEPLIAESMRSSAELLESYRAENAALKAAVSKIVAVKLNGDAVTDAGKCMAAVCEAIHVLHENRTLFSYL